MKLRFLLDIVLSHGQDHPGPLSASAKNEGPWAFEVSLRDGEPTNTPFFLYDLPSYQKLVLHGELKTFKKMDSPLYKGFLIDLSPYPNLDSYLKSHFPTTTRMFRRHGKRLREEIGSTTKIYYGNSMDEAELNLLFDRLGMFLTNRFEQKESENYELPLLPLYKEMLRTLVPKGEAVIFARFHGKDPIGIGIGFVNANILYLFNIAFDVQYGQYGLGNQLLLDVLGWCFEKKISTVDMGRGDFFHKRKWVNGTYTYREVSLFKTSDVLGIFKACTVWTLNTLRYNAIIFLKKIGGQHMASKFLLWKYRLWNRHRQD